MQPGPTAQKNISLSPAASDLGLGDSLQQQLQDQLAERRKRMGQPAGAAEDLLGQFAMLGNPPKIGAGALDYAQSPLKAVANGSLNGILYPPTADNQQWLPGKKK